MKTIWLAITLSSYVWLSAPLANHAGKGEQDWTKFGISMLFKSEYSAQQDRFPTDWRKVWSDNVLLDIIKGNFYKDQKNFDLLARLGDLKSKSEQEKLEKINSRVNKLFDYYSGPFNYWYSEPPMVSLLLGLGDCKSYAYYKFWTLRQLGYTNVKLVSVVLPDGKGDLAGHVVVVVNDLWVLDINYPYMYPFEVLRWNTALDEAFFPDGTVWDVK